MLRYMSERGRERRLDFMSAKQSSFFYAYGFSFLKMGGDKEVILSLLKVRHLACKCAHGLTLLQYEGLVINQRFEQQDPPYELWIEILFMERKNYKKIKENFQMEELENLDVVFKLVIN